MKQHNSFFYLGMAVCLMFMSCKPGARLQDAPLKWRIVAQGAYSGITEASQREITDSDSWRTYWASLHAQELTLPDLPEIDFSTEYLLCCAMGQQSGGGHEIGLAQLLTSGNGIEANWVFSHPGPGCITTMALSQPFLVVAVSRHGATLPLIRHNITERSTRCN